MLEDKKRELELRSGQSPESCLEEDIYVVLMRIRVENLQKVNLALLRLEGGSYGNCLNCGDEIPEVRLLALPFAVRCKDCEEAKEAADRRIKEFIRLERGDLFRDVK